MSKHPWINILSLVLMFCLAETSARAFDDTVFGTDTLEDLDVKKAPEKESPRPPMVLEPDLIESGDLPPVEQPNVSLPPPATLQPPTTPPAPVSEQSEVSLSREDKVVGTEDLDVVGTKLEWEVPPALDTPTTPTSSAPETPPSAPSVQAPSAPKEDSAPAPKSSKIKISVKTQPAPMPEAPPSTVEPVPMPEAQAQSPVIPIPLSPVLPEIQPAPMAPQIAFANETYEGPLISAYLVNVPISEAIKAIAYSAGQRVIVPEEIPGRITINVEDKDWKWVIDAAIRSKPYVALMAEGTLVVSENVNQVKGPPIQQHFQLNHILPSTLATRIKPFLTAEGKIFADDANSTLILHDAPAAISMVAKIVQAVDIPQKKILIEAKLVEMEGAVAKEFGVNWSLTYQDNVNLVTGTISNSFNPSTIASRLGVRATSGNMTFSSFLDFLETSDKIKVVSEPRVITINNMAASLGQTDQFVYPTQVQGSAGTSVGYSSLNADTSLNIRPRIVNHNAVEMSIEVTRAYPNDVNHPNLPQKFQKQRASTLLVVKNGETAVIGGLKAQREQRQKQGIPFLKDIPVLGFLFGNEKDVAQNRDLMIFVQPKIL